MGSVSRTNNIEEFVKKNGKKIEAEFQQLIGAKIVSLSEVVADYYVKGKMTLSNGEQYEVHYRWSSQEEDAEKCELDMRYKTMERYFSDGLMNRSIEKIEVKQAESIDDEVYLALYVDDTNERFSADIPLGFDPETGEVSPSLEKLVG